MQEKLYKVLLDRASDGMVLADEDGRILYVNQRIVDLSGYPRESLVGMYAKQLHPKDQADQVVAAFEDIRCTGSSLREHDLLAEDGRRIPVEVAGSRINYGDGPGGRRQLMLGVFRELSERRRAEAERLRRERRQRETIVREVHHRIKNHLQGLVGLLAQHARSHGENADTLRVVMAQIGSIAQTHGLQGRSEEYELRLCELVQSICQSVASIMVLPQADVAVALRVEKPVVLAVEEGVPLALVLNELCLNAVKHGARSDRGGAAVEVEVAGTQDDARVRVFNRGGHLPPGFELERWDDSGSGLGLVRSLLPRQGATLTLREEEGGVAAHLALRPPVIGQTKKTVNAE